MSIQNNINSVSQGSGDLFDLLSDFIEMRSGNFHTSIPARVEEVFYNKGYATVQPLIKTITKKGSVFADKHEQVYPLVYEVPIFISSANRGTARITMPVKKGDVGVLTFSERDTETYLNTSGVEVVDSDNYATLSQDGKPAKLVFIPEIFTASEAPPIDSENIIITNDKSVYTMKPDGTTIDTDGQTTITRSSDGTITLETQSDTIKLNNGSITIISSGSVDVTSADCNVTSSGNVAVTATGSVGVTATGTVTMTGSSVNLNGAISGGNGDITTASGNSLDELREEFDQHIHDIAGDKTSTPI